VPESPTIRNAARVLVVDESDRVLLFRLEHPDTGRSRWITPGGGLEPGEDHRMAAARELREETGMDASAIGAEIWHRRNVFTWGDAWIDQHERFFLARVDTFTPDLSGFTEEEQTAVLEWRWWTADELASTADGLAPSELAALLRGLLRDGPPPRPVTIGV
jgi:8-oxo-dGTP pyrophosphatase MutT (NUDIX family)